MEKVAKVLVVDDEAGIRFFLEELLTRDGHQVVAVDSGEAALERAAVEEFDLALVDLKMKGISGTKVLAELRQQSPDTVVIMLTGHGSLETAVEALRQGAHDYLFKPCKTVELRESIRRGLFRRQQKERQRKLLKQLEQRLTNSLQEVRASIGMDDMDDMGDVGAMDDVGQDIESGVGQPSGTSVSAPEVSDPAQVLQSSVASSLDLDEPYEEEGRFLQWGGLIIDLTRHVTTLDGHLLELSPTEFDLLAYMVSEAPRVVSPQELVREVQGYESEPWEASETVRYHIYRLRQKIKAVTEESQVIRTVRGVGYTVASRSPGVQE